MTDFERCAYCEETRDKCRCSEPWEGLLTTDRLVMTPGVQGIILQGKTRTAVMDRLREAESLAIRALAGEDGDMCEEDKEANGHARKHGYRTISSFQFRGTKVWVIVDAAEDPAKPNHRYACTVLLPEEY